MDAVRRAVGTPSLERARRHKITNWLKKPITCFVLKQRSWYGYVQRMTDERLPKNVMKLILQENRKTGRPSKWIEGIAEWQSIPDGRSKHERGLNEGDCYDRKNWHRTA